MDSSIISDPAALGVAPSEWTGKVVPCPADPGLASALYLAEKTYAVASVVSVVSDVVALRTLDAA